MSSSSTSPCNFPDPNGSPKTVLLIGDSHAAQFAQVFISAAKASRVNLQIFTEESCSLILNSIADSLCAEHNNKIFRYVISHHLDAIVVSEYIRASQSISDYLVPLMRLADSGSRIILLGNTPVFFYRRYMQTPALFQSPYLAPKTVNESELNSPDVQASERLLLAPSKHGIIINNLNSVWKSGNYYVRSDSTGDFFYDAGHLSVTGANMALPNIISILSDVANPH